MRRAAKIDANQAEIVDAARRMGCTVQLLHTVGEGVPDLLVGISGHTDLWEVKDGKKPPSERKLTPAQIEWHGNWRGCAVQVIESVEMAIERINKLRKDRP